MNLQIPVIVVEVKRLHAVGDVTRATLADTVIYSPLNGVILTKNFENGEYLTVGSAIATVGELLGYVPQKFSLYGEIMRSIILKGVGLSVVWPQVLALILYTTITLTISIKKFQKKIV